ncbi:MAG: DUF6630 family protein, partial [Moheibacter sp.]
IYIENNDRMVTVSGDYLWLAMVDLLIDYGYAFEIDWKEYFDIAQDLTQKLINKINLGYHFKNDIVDDLDAEEFFPLMDKEIKENTAFQLCNLDIDSDSYVTTLVAKDNFERLKQIDNRIKPY